MLCCLSSLDRFGWFGFNAGSCLTAATSEGALVMANTQISAATGMLTFGAMEMIFSGELWFSGRPTAVGASTGAVTGLVAITPAAGFISPVWAIFFGSFTTAVCFFAPGWARKTGVIETCGKLSQAQCRCVQVKHVLPLLHRQIVLRTTVLVGSLEPSSLVCWHQKSSEIQRRKAPPTEMATSSSLSSSQSWSRWGCLLLAPPPSSGPCS